MKKTEKYLQAESIVVQPEIYHHEAIYKAQAYLDAYKEGYEQALSLGGVGQSFGCEKKHCVAELTLKGAWCSNCKKYLKKIAT